MNEPTAGADQPNEHRQAEEAILAAIEKGVTKIIGAGAARAERLPIWTREGGRAYALQAAYTITAIAPITL